MATFGNTPATASDAGLLTDDPASSDVLLLGAAGSSGRLIAAELAARDLSTRLAGRRRGPLEDLAQGLAADGATIGVRTVDVSDAASLAEAIAGVRVVVSTIGPFARLAGPVIDACLAARSHYVDIANEWSAVRDLLDRDEHARAREVALVTGAGFGPAATETLVMRLVGLTGMVPARVRVAAAAQVTRHGEGVRQTIEESLSQGAITYRDGQVVREPLGSGSPVLTFGGTQRRMLPGPIGDLEAARRASGAPDVVAYIADPAAPRGGSSSYAWAEVVAPDGSLAVAELVTGEGLRATAAIAAETTRRVLAGGAAGAWTPGRLFGPDLVTDATGAEVTVDGQPA
jgi:saccharopine dehydrogenase (NAD+, L-lysine-forming)